MQLSRVLILRWYPKRGNVKDIYSRRFASSDATSKHVGAVYHCLQQIEGSHSEDAQVRFRYKPRCYLLVLVSRT
jgi:hypothetical protein